MDKIKFEPYGDLADQAFSQFNNNSVNNQDPHSKTENNQTPEAEYPNENHWEDKEKRKFAIPTFMPQILPDDEIAGNKI